MKSLAMTTFNTPLGSLVTVGDDEALYFLQFEDCKVLGKELEWVKARTGRSITSGKAASLHSIENELQLYFEGKLKEFKTPLVLLGSDFQKRVWQELMKIPYGETRSYTDISKGVGNPLAFRAAANANGANLISIVIPCHRVINKSGALGGYAGGIYRKKELLQLENSERKEAAMLAASRAVLPSRS